MVSVTASQRRSATSPVQEKAVPEHRAEARPDTKTPRPKKVEPEVAPLPKPTPQTSADTRIRVANDPAVRARQEQLSTREPSSRDVRALLQTSVAHTRTADAPEAVRDEVRSQLERVDRRLVSQEITPRVALGQTKLWNQHLDQASQAQARERVTRAEQIDKMSPIQRAGEFALGLGDGALETVEGLGKVAKTINDLNPVTAGSNVLAGTLVRTVQNGGDAGKALQDSWKSQVADTRTALDNTGRTAQGLAQLATDANNINPILAPTGVVADTLVGTLRTGDVGKALQSSVSQRWQDAQDSAGRLTNLAGEVSGVSKIASGDPRKIGEGTFDLASLVVPLGKAKGLSKVDDVANIAKNNIVPFSRPAGAGVARTPVPSTRPPVGVALDEPLVITRQPVLTKATPDTTLGAGLELGGRGTIASLGKGNGGGRIPPMPTGLAPSGGGGDSRPGGDRTLDDLERNFRARNGNLSKLSDDLGHDRRHAIFGQKTNHQGEAMVNGAESSFLAPGELAKLGQNPRAFFEAKGLQQNLTRFEDAVTRQLVAKKSEVLGAIDRTPGDLLDQHAAVVDKARSVGLRDLGDTLPSGGTTSRELDALFDAHVSDPAAYRRAVSTYLDQKLGLTEGQRLTPELSQKVRQRFEANVSYLDALWEKNQGLWEQPGRSSGQPFRDLVYDDALSRELVAPTGAEVRASADRLAPRLRRP
jgi:hypothetical protein